MLLSGSPNGGVSGAKFSFAITILTSFQVLCNEHTFINDLHGMSHRKMCSLVAVFFYPFSNGFDATDSVFVISCTREGCQHHSTVKCDKCNPDNFFFWDFVHTINLSETAFGASVKIVTVFKKFKFYYNHRIDLT